jgi:hypothetical protein
MDNAKARLQKAKEMLDTASLASSRSTYASATLLSGPAWASAFPTGYGNPSQRAARARNGNALLPLQLGQLSEYFAYALAPVCAQCGEISIALVEAAPHAHRQAVALVAN